MAGSPRIKRVHKDYPVFEADGRAPIMAANHQKQSSRLSHRIVKTPRIQHLHYVFGVNLARHDGRRSHVLSFAANQLPTLRFRLR